MTRTYTVFFNDDQPAVIKLRETVDEVEEDWLARRQYVTDERIAAAGDRRVNLLRLAAGMLTERTPV